MPDDPVQFLPLSPHQFQILLALIDGDRHGHAVIQDIDQRTGGEMRLGTGTLDTAIARLVDLGLIEDSGRVDDRRRYYRLLPSAGPFSKRKPDGSRRWSVMRMPKAFGRSAGCRVRGRISLHTELNESANPEH